MAPAISASTAVRRAAAVESARGAGGYMELLSQRERWRIRLTPPGNTLIVDVPRLEILEPIRNGVDSLEGSVEWVELPLLIGQALVTAADTAALAHLNSAAERLMSIKDPPVDLQIRVQEHLGHFYRSVAKRPSKAKEHYIAAKQIACNAHCNEEAARVQLKICEIDLVTDKDPNLTNFQSSMRLGKAEFPATDILEAWTLLISTTESLQRV